MAAVNTVNVVMDLSGFDGVIAVAKQRNITLKAVRRMAAVVRPAVKAESPRRASGGGTLKSAISSKAVKGKKGKTGSFGVVGARVKVQRTITVKTPRGARTLTAIPSKYQHLVALGTRPHSLSGGSKLVRKGKSGLDIGQSSGARHPGAAANNFLLRGFRAKQAEAMSEGKRVLGEEVQKAIAKESSRLLAKLRKAF